MDNISIPRNKLKCPNAWRSLPSVAMFLERKDVYRIQCATILHLVSGTLKPGPAQYESRWLCLHTGGQYVNEKTVRLHYESLPQ